MGRNAAQDEQIREYVDDIKGFELAGDTDRQALPCELIDDAQHAELPAIMSAVLDEVVGPWLYVDDHVRALWLIATRGRTGETYNVGGGAERKKLEVAETICDLVDALRPSNDGSSRRRLLTFVADRPGHDHRYAIDASKLARELGWRPQESFDSGLKRTVEWYLGHPDWWTHIRTRL